MLQEHYNLENDKRILILVVNLCYVIQVRSVQAGLIFLAHPVIKWKILLLSCIFDEQYENADADMQEEIDAYISKGSATFHVLIIVCTDNSSLVALLHVLHNFKSQFEHVYDIPLKVMLTISLKHFDSQMLLLRIGSQQLYS